jgi:sugar transferase (PEP-CTERM/EpsH1 system associated)
MNILSLAHRIPFPPNKGDKLRAFRQIEHLARRHRVWCACFVDTPSDFRYVEPLRAHCEQLAAIPLRRSTAALRGLLGLARGKTITESFYAHPALWSTLRTWCDSVRFDVVVAFSSSMVPYALGVPAVRRVLDLCDLDSQKWLDYADFSRGPGRWMYTIEGHRLALKERQWLELFDATIVITEAEAAPLRQCAPPGKLHIVGNGVPLPDVAASEVGMRNCECGMVKEPPHSAFRIPHSAFRRVVGFVGAMDYRPNVDAVYWFVSECWNDIRAACPAVVLRIVGRSPARRVRGLQTMPGVEVVGDVEDVAAEVRRFDVSVAPMRIARGLQNKVLEAMAAAKPVVLTSKAAEGINARHSQEYLVADRPAQIVEAVVRLLTNPAESERLGQAARYFVATHHRWEEVLREFELIVTGVIERTERSTMSRCDTHLVARLCTVL